MSRRLGKRVHTKDQLAALAKRMEAAIEELQACRKELQACREELQTSKARIAELEAELAARPTKGKPDKHDLPPAGMIRKLAYELFEMHGGRPIDRAIHTCDLKSKMFISQCKGSGSGLSQPTITPRESRMNESNIARLTRQRDALYRRCEKEAIAELRDIEAGRFFSAGDPVPYNLGHKSDVPSGLPMFAAEELESYLDWQINPFKHKVTPTDFKISEVFEAVARSGVDHPQTLEIAQEMKARLQKKYPQANSFAEAVDLMQAEINQAAMSGTTP